MTTRFCSSCQCYRDTNGGVGKKTNRSWRWICKPCVEHKTESIYKNRSGKTVNVAELMAKLYSARGER